MALDGAYLSRIKREIEQVALGARVDKIAQPTREELILHLRWRGDGGRLLISAGAGNARVHFTRTSPENPKAPPMFCMLLRKHLSGAKLTGVRQLGLDRALYLDFDTTDELGDPIVLTLAVEIMGRHSNVILVGPEERIIDSIRRVDLTTSSVRQVLPGMRYHLPPSQHKLNLLLTTPEEVVERVKNGRDVAVDKALMDILEGVSPLLCREIACRAVGDGEYTVSQLEDRQYQALRSTVEQLIQTLTADSGEPVMLTEADGRPRDFCFMPIFQYGSLLQSRPYESCSALLDAFYAQRDLSERMRQRAGDLLKLLNNIYDRVSRKLTAQHQELIQCAQRQELKIKGDLISANLYTLQKGEKVARLVNFYDENQPQVDILLDPMLTPVQNAQRYYALYRKADTAEKMLQQLIRQGEEELRYIDSVLDALTRITTEAELEAIREELAQGGLARRQTKAGSKQKKPQKLAPLRYRSTDGFTILVGRNNIQNDRLTLKESHGLDLWCHTQKIPGSHTIVVAEGKEVPLSTIEQACILAAYHSKARDSSKVAVDYTPVRYVKKPGGAKPGMVIYDRYETAIVDPDPQLAERLKQD